MPSVRIDALEGRSKHEIERLLDAVHRAIVSAFPIKNEPISVCLLCVFQRLIHRNARTAGYRYLY